MYVPHHGLITYLLRFTLTFDALIALPDVGQVQLSSGIRYNISYPGYISTFVFSLVYYIFDPLQKQIQANLDQLFRNIS